MVKLIEGILDILGKLEFDALLGAMLVLVYAKLKTKVASTFVNPVYPAQSTSASISLPAEVIDYCEGESELWAQDDCKVRAQAKFAELKNFDVVLTSLQREDGEIK